MNSGHECLLFGTKVAILSAVMDVAVSVDDDRYKLFNAECTTLISALCAFGTGKVFVCPDRKETCCSSSVYPNDRERHKEFIYNITLLRVYINTFNSSYIINC